LGVCVKIWIERACKFLQGTRDQMAKDEKVSAEEVVGDIDRQTRKKYR
jgi:hypothetical protein